MFYKLLFCVASVLFLFGCESERKNVTENGKATIGVSMPTQSLQRWNQDAQYIKEDLEAMGYGVDLQYASNDVDTQISQIASMLDNGVEVLIIVPIDSYTLVDILDKAKSLGVAVIAYDRLIMNSDAISYFISFDSYDVGVMQGRYIEEKLDLASGAGAFNIELVTGDLTYYNTKFYFDGAMDILAPYVQSGQLVVRSGQSSIEDAATERWASDIAQARFDRMIGTTYSRGEKMDAVLCSNDAVAVGVIRALQYADYDTNRMPIITGQDCDVLNVRYIIDGWQSMSVFKDTRELAHVTAAIVSSIIEGKPLDIAATSTTYYNGLEDVPSFMLLPEVIDFSNYKEILIDGGYYKAEDFG